MEVKGRGPLWGAGAKPLRKSPQISNRRLRPYAIRRTLFIVLTGLTKNRQTRSFSFYAIQVRVERNLSLIIDGIPYRRYRLRPHCRPPRLRPLDTSS